MIYNFSTVRDMFGGLRMRRTKYFIVALSFLLFLFSSSFIVFGLNQLTIPGLDRTQVYNFSSYVSSPSCVGVGCRVGLDRDIISARAIFPSDMRVGGSLVCTVANGLCVGGNGSSSNFSLVDSTYACNGTDKLSNVSMIGGLLNGVCTADETGGGSGVNPFDQSLNTTDNVNFSTLYVHNSIYPNSYNYLSGNYINTFDNSSSIYRYGTTQGPGYLSVFQQNLPDLTIVSECVYGGDGGGYVECYTSEGDWVLINNNSFTYLGGNVCTDTNGLCFSSVGFDVIPSINNTYSLGSPDFVWRDVYVGSDSLYIGDKKLSNSNGELYFDNKKIGDKGDKGDNGTDGSPGTNGTNGLDGSPGTNGTNASVVSADSYINVTSGMITANITKFDLRYPTLITLSSYLQNTTFTSTLSNYIQNISVYNVTVMNASLIAINTSIRGRAVNSTVLYLTGGTLTGTLNTKNLTVGFNGYIAMNGTMNTSCNATTEGYIIYNYTQHKHWGCNGTAWNGMY